MKRASVIVTLTLAVLTVMVLVISVPDSLRDDFKHHDLYVFSRSFIQDIPKRLSGPGRFRLILQPLVASILGIRSGLVDVRLGRPPYLSALLFRRGHRRELLRNTFLALTNLLLMGILLDSLFQWLIYGISHPGAALIVGPTLIAVPYALARELAHRSRTLQSGNTTRKGEGRPDK
jgi:hypothetical protein